MDRVPAIITILAVLAAPPARPQDSIDPAHADEGDGTAIVPPGSVDAPLDAPLRVPALRPSAGPGPSFRPSPSSVEIDEAACRRAARRAQVEGADLVPGVDVHGDPVAPADLPDGGPVGLPDRFAIPVTDDLARGLGLPRAIQQKAYVGLVTVDGGRLSFNGRPIGDQAAGAVAEACRNRTGPPPAADGNPAGAR
jgi:hypothetical protein